MSRYLLIERATGRVANIVLATETGASPEAPEGYETVPETSSDVGLGWRLEKGVFLPPDAPHPTAEDVRSEASRRLQQLLGARDAAHLEILVANGTREAVRLLRIKSARAWTEEEAARAATLEAVDRRIEDIRAASNILEPCPPADYQRDSHWP